MLHLAEGRYSIQGIDLLQLAEDFALPLFVYDGSAIAAQYRRLVDAFPEMPLSIKYAAKALTNIAILKLIKKLGAGLDAVSIHEIDLGLRAGFAPAQIIFTPNGVAFDEIRAAVDRGVLVNLDNISILERFGHAYSGTVPCCIRLNPHILAGGNPKIQTGHIDSKFGISIYQIRHLLRVIETYGIRVIGLHMHTGSEILDTSVFGSAAEILYQAARDFPDLRFIDFGSGFKVPYHEGQVATDVEALGQMMTGSFRQFCKEYGRDLEIWFEPGKYLVSDAGYFLVRTNVVKQTVSTVFAGVDSGLNHLLRPMLYDAYHGILNLSNPEGHPRVYSVVGYICETDTFAADRPVPDIREGDILAFQNAGAYCFEMSSRYNSRLRPAEVLIHEGRPHLIRRRETFDDLVQNQIEVDL